ncbi:MULTISPECIES: AraC family transcriptional regulator [unclassified Phenylobacterium]|uniref:AraC family transcriptional regulator n=1 Tax=unclassified Phenylobacterium TaxID=2640670 RepID=UPI000839FED1|nr:MULTISPECIES: AraC family transcriptional regulator [unclassified Phenylobacterium]
MTGVDRLGRANRALAAWRGELTVGDGWARWQGAAGDNTLHRHLAAQAVLAAQPVGLHRSDGGVVRGRVVLIDPLVAHRLDRASNVEIIFFEPAALQGDAAEVLARVPADDPDAIRLESDEPRRRFWSRPRGVPGAREGPSPTLRRALAQLEAELPNGPVRLAAAAAAAGLSPDRFRHVFVEAVGVPFRRYLLWKRLQRAVALRGEGCDATTAAHGAGFADSAHLARTIRAMFGISASQLGGAG